MSNDSFVTGLNSHVLDRDKVQRTHDTRAINKNSSAIK